MQSIQDYDFDPEKCIADEFVLGELDPSPQPASPIQELAQSAAASLTPITAAAPSGAERWKEMGNAQARAQKRLNELVKNDAELSCIANEHYGMRFKAASFMKAKEGTSKVCQAIIEHLLTQAGAVKSQTQVREYVAAMFPSYTVPKNWTQPLPEWAVRNIQKRIRNSAAPISNIQLHKAITLSLLHKAAAAAMERHKTGVQTFRPVVEVSDTSILINGVAFPVSDNKVKGGKYKYLRAPMPKLFQALDSIN
ncbi:hypothetical protein [Acidovorax sp.]|uniref:hypothetical protein n=1 Tax=Acidovorax sp. TaxID=1872122 RepID=UPI003BAFFB8E